MEINFQHLYYKYDIQKSESLEINGVEINDVSFDQINELDSMLNESKSEAQSVVQLES